MANPKSSKAGIGRQEKMKTDLILPFTGAAIAIFFILLITFPRRSSIRKFLGLEGFAGGTLSPALFGIVTPDPVSGPAPASLNERVPYHLLQGVLKDAPVDNQDNSKLNSCACYKKDFQNRIQLTGNYTQLTNNYKRSNPDSCSAPFHELVNNFYEVQKLNV
jgi:hypothetical protein